MDRIDVDYANELADLFFQILILVFIVILLTALVYSFIKKEMLIMGLSIAGISSVYMLYMKFFGLRLKKAVIDAASPDQINSNVLEEAVKQPDMNLDGESKKGAENGNEREDSTK